MFVDDLVVFSRANHDDLAAVQSCLTQFQNWSGLSINKRKSAITFSRNVSPSCKISLRNLIGLNQPTSKNFYLGLPTHIQRGHQAQFNTILEKINSRISGWKAKILSQAAKATLIKSVLSSIPSYWMSSFKLPKSICSKIDAKLRDFFWGFIDSGHHMYPKAWDSLCKPKSAGGLGFRRAHDINNALISKLGWIIASSADKPWANLLQSKYLRGRPFLTSTLQQNSSYIWKGIHKSIPLIKKRLLLPHWIRFFGEHLA